MLAKDIMTKNVVSIRSDTPILKAIDLLLEKKISGLPVVDEQMSLVGVLSGKDLLNILFIKDIDINTPIERFMTQEVIKFDVNDSVIDIADLFLKKFIRRVPIVENDKLVGIISRGDMLKVVVATILDMKDKNKGS